MIKQIFLSAILVLLMFVQGAMAQDDFQYWSQLSLKPYKSEKVDLVVFTDSRFTHDAEKLGLYFISPRFIYHQSKNLDMGINYTYLQSRKTIPSAIDDSYHWQHRLEFEYNPRWMITGQWKITMRNRMEFRAIENRGTDNARYRQRWTLDCAIKNKLPLKSIYANSEFFYDFKLHDYSENRTIPLGLNFKVSQKVGFGIFYMIQSQLGTKDWSSNQIVGTLLSAEF